MVSSTRPPCQVFVWPLHALRDTYERQWRLVRCPSNFGLWCRYVVDSADPEALEQSRHELHELLSKPSLAGIPVLVLGNKNDLPGALKEMELIEQM